MASDTSEDCATNLIKSWLFKFVMSSICLPSSESFDDADSSGELAWLNTVRWLRGVGDCGLSLVSDCGVDGDDTWLGDP